MPPVTRVDFLASEQHYCAHLGPIWNALPPEARGTFYALSRGGDRLDTGALKPPVVDVRSLPPGTAPTVVASFSDLCQCVGRPVALVEHGCGSAYKGANPGFSGGTDRDCVGLFVCPSRRVADANLARYPDATAAVVGCPAMDPWHCTHTPPRSHGGGWFEGHNAPRGPINSPPFCASCGHPYCPGQDGDSCNEIEPVGDGFDRRPVVAFSWHWPMPGTFAGNALEAFEPIMPEVWRRLRDDGATVLGHGHPRILPRIRAWYERHGIEVVPTFAEVLDRADLYVADNTSSIFEFASTGRPVVLMDHHDWLVGPQRGPWPRFQRPTSQVGLHCNASVTDVLLTIQTALEDPPEVAAARDVACREVYAYTDGRAAQRAADALMAWRPSWENIRRPGGRG